MSHGGPSNQLPIAIAHRGGNEIYPENTIEAFKDAVAMGYQRLETDVHFTQSGELLAIHGQTYEGGDEGPDNNNYVHIANKPVLISTIKPEDRPAMAEDGFYIPTLDEVLDINNEVHWNIDAKKQEAVEPLLTVLRKQSAFPRVTLASFNEESIGRLRAGSPDGTSTALVQDELMQIYFASLDPETKVDLPSNTRAQVPTHFGDIEIITPEIMATAKRLNIPVDVWTINDMNEMLRLMDAGVDGIFTDKLRTLQKAQQIDEMRKFHRNMTAEIDEMAQDASWAVGSDGKIIQDVRENTELYVNTAHHSGGIKGARYILDSLRQQFKQNR